MSIDRSQGPQGPATPTHVPARPRTAFLELVQRYAGAFRQAWTQRRDIAGPRRMADEAAFLPAALSLQETPVHPSPRRLAWALSALFLIALAWTIIGRIDIVAVAPGRLIVSERTKLIQPLEASVVQRVWVRDGDHVRAGQVLVELDPTAAQADRTSIDNALRSERCELVRVQQLWRAIEANAAPRIEAQALGAGESDLGACRIHLAAEWGDISARIARADAELVRRQAEIRTARERVAKFEQTVPILRQRESDFAQLGNQGFVSGHATQDRTRERIELERDLATAHAHLAETLASLRESQNGRSAYLAETRRGLQEREAAARLKLRQAEQELAKAEQRQRRTTLVAPVDGVVQQLAAHTEGGVVTEAQALMVVVPDGASMSAEVMLDNKDIGFVATGQDAQIKLETFPFTRYGTVPARVKTVTADAVNDEKRGAIFPVTLKLERLSIDVDGRTIALAPGMNLSAEIKTGQRRIIEFLLSPIQRAMKESLHER